MYLFLCSNTAPPMIYTLSLHDALPICTGLGLSIVKALVTGQNGRINVLSKPNEFTSFIIHLPYKKGEKVIKQDTEVEVKAMVEPFYFKGKVWIIDDDKYILSWLKTVLELHQIEVIAFS